jgi:hypothetical protein
LIEIVSPAWLAGLTLVPLIRVLHQWRGAGPLRVVPAAFLWRDTPIRGETGARFGPPDPAWRRRALAAALLILTLADPGWRTRDLRPVEVVVDNRPSLLTQEANGQRRVDQAALALHQALVLEQDPRMRLIPAAGHDPPPDLDARDLAGLTRALEQLAVEALDAGAALAPLPGSSGPRRWLVSDGSADSAGLAGLGPFERVFRLGRVTENQGITRLAARPALDALASLDTLVTVVNRGEQAAERTLTLIAGGRTLGQAVLQVPAGATVSRTWRVPWSGPGTLAANLTPADALASDDRLLVDLDPLVPLRVQVAGPCATTVMALLVAHPALRPDPAQDPQEPAALRAWCRAEEPPTPGPPTLWLPPGQLIEAPAGSVRWSVPGPHPQLPAAEPWSPLVLDPGPAGTILLAAGGYPLIIEQPAAHRLVGLFDTRPDAVGAGGLPLLLDWMLARLSGRDLLDPVASVVRPPAAVRVAPGPLPPATPVVHRDSSQAPPRPLWPLALIAAIALLGLDVPRLGSRRPGARELAVAPHMNANRPG